MAPVAQKYRTIMARFWDKISMEIIWNMKNDGIVQDKQLIPGWWNAKFNFIFIFQTTNQIFPSLFSFRS